MAMARPAAADPFPPDSLTRAGLPVAGVLLCIAAVTLWDFYWSGVRPFDLLAVAALCAILLTRPRALLALDRARPLVVALGATALIAFASSMDNPDAGKTAVGVVLGLLFAIGIAVSPLPLASLLRCLDGLIVLNGVALILQAAIYVATGEVVRPHALLGAESRLMSSFFRPAGLFQEPAHFCLMMFSLLTLRSNLQAPSRLLLAMGLGTMLLSLSLWGYAAAGLYVLLYRPAWLLWVLPPALALGTFAYSQIDLQGTPVGTLIIDRVTNLDSDNSANARYAGLASTGPGIIGTWPLWFGHGFDSDYVFAFGASGLSFLLYVVGVVGVVAVLGLFGALCWRVGRLRALPAMAMMLTAASQWTWLWWWAWMALTLTMPAPSAPVGRTRRDAM